MNAIRIERDADQIVTLVMDLPGQSANTMNATFREGMEAALRELEADPSAIRGIILASAKKTFFAGGDLNELIQATPEHAQAFHNMVEGLKGYLRRLEKLGKPTVAAINGAALGGGWEICLACIHRIALADPKLKMGLPEVTLGLLPGAGGVVRMVRLLGLQAAFPYLMEGKQFGVAEGQKLGLVHDTAESREDLLAKARAWILANPTARQPWDTEGYKLPGGTPSNPKIAQMISVAPAMLKDKTKGNYPAPEAILCAAVEGAQVDFDTALRIETRYFTELAVGQVSKNMIGTFWFQMNDLKAGKSRPQGVPQWQATRVGVIGAGMMGAGIAYATASKGVNVVLKDVTQDAAEKGKAYSVKLLEKRVAKGRMSEAQKNQILERILPTANAADFAGCDLIIEAVFENRELKAKVTAEAEAHLVADGIMSSNTSTLPITGLAKASRDASRFIGLHFFSPVDKMQLVEIIKGEQTSPETLAKAFDYVLQIGKLPIVVNDSRGFFTSRVFTTFVNEGMAMLAEGVPASAIEMAGLKAGMPVGPLAVTDEVSLTLIEHIMGQTKADYAAEGKPWTTQACEGVVQKLIHGEGRKGKAAGAGFYEYPAGGKKHLWPGLKSWETEAGKAIPLQDLVDRVLFMQAIETLRCREEGVLESARDANIGSIFGIGYPAWTGGAIQFLNQYGLARAVARLEVLQARYGDRFAPTAGLRAAAESQTLLS